MRNVKTTSEKFKNVKFPVAISVTEHKIKLPRFTKKQKNFYLALLKKIVSIYKLEGKPRMVIGIVGPGGSGKSVLAVLLKEIARQVHLPFRFEQVDGDAFHYPNVYLLSHCDRNHFPLKAHKGRFDTYNVKKLITILKQFSKSKKVSLPAYSRRIHDPVENAITINESPVVLIITGLWLLRNKGEWRKVRKFLDFTFFINADDEGKIKNAVTKRHMRGGRTLKDATRFYEESDAKNFQSVMGTKKRADKILPPFYKI